MDRPTPEIAATSVEPAVRLPLDLDDDPTDESIYGTGYRARVGMVVADQQPAVATEPSATGRAPRR